MAHFWQLRGTCCHPYNPAPDPAQQVLNMANPKQHDRAARIELALRDSIDMSHLQVLDESQNHSVPEGAQSHFKVVIVAGCFEGQSRLARHRLVNGLVADEFQQGLHALAVHTFTESEWRDRFGNAPMSPPCANAPDTKENAGSS